MMHQEAPRAVKIIAFALVVVFVFLCVMLVRQFEHARRMHQIDSYKTLVNKLRDKAPLDVSDVSIIQSWMTFSYIDTIFNLPPTYLQTTLAVTDTHYPRISLGRYAKSQNVSEADFVERVKAAVTSYLTHATSTPLTATTTQNQ